VIPPQAVQEFTPGGQPLDPENLDRVPGAFTAENVVIVNEVATTGSTWSAMHASKVAPTRMVELTMANMV
jgi:hypothetical protein